MRFYVTTMFITITTTVHAFGIHARRLGSTKNIFRRSFSKSCVKSSKIEIDAEASSMIEKAAMETRKMKEFYKESMFQTPTVWSNTDAINYVRNDIDTVLFDCDGVLYNVWGAYHGASDTINGLMAIGKKVLFVTNNGGINRRQLRDKLSKMLGIELTTDQMVSSSYACAQYLMLHLDSGSRVHVIGSAGLCEELANCGFIITGGPSTADESPSMDRDELAQYNFGEHQIDAIAVGHDIEFTFRKLTIANNLLLRNPNCLFVATNHDNFDLVGSDGRHIPGNGCTVKALEYCSRRKSTNVGKPSNTLADLIAKEHDLEPSRCLFVGDRLDTDIKFGIETGMKSLLVMTGVTTADHLIELGKGNEEEPLPNYILPHVGLLM